MMTTLFSTYRNLLEKALGLELPVAELNFLEDLSASHEGHDLAINELDGILTVQCHTCNTNLHDVEMVRETLKKK